MIKSFSFSSRLHRNLAIHLSEIDESSYWWKTHREYRLYDDDIFNEILITLIDTKNDVESRRRKKQ